MPSLILFNKPYGVLSQFRQDTHNNFATLSNYFSDKSLRVAGRLDATSEGLLILTADGRINEALTAPPQVLAKKNGIEKLGKTYWVQVEGLATSAQIQQLCDGVPLKDGMTLPALVERLSTEQIANLWPPAPNIARRQVTTWLAITIYEGKNRQVRRMTAHVGLPCLRLIRVASSGFYLNDIAVGKQRRINLNEADLVRLGISTNKSSHTAQHRLPQKGHKSSTKQKRSSSPKLNIPASTKKRYRT